MPSLPRCATTIGFFSLYRTNRDANANQPVAVAGHTADPGLTLVSGITSTDLYLKHFAYAELRDFASAESPEASTRRSALFNDQKHIPNMWVALARESLLTLGRDYQLFLRRGQPAAPRTPLPFSSDSRFPLSNMALPSLLFFSFPHSRRPSSSSQIWNAAPCEREGHAAAPHIRLQTRAVLAPPRRSRHACVRRAARSRGLRDGRGRRVAYPRALPLRHALYPTASGRREEGRGERRGDRREHEEPLARDT